MQSAIVHDGARNGDVAAGELASSFNRKPQACASVVVPAPDAWGSRSNDAADAHACGLRSHDEADAHASTNEVVEEVVTFRCGPYRLEGVLAYPADIEPQHAVAIAGPHPLLGGDMHNNVVAALGVGLAERGATTLRFNYRGVGQSAGPKIDVAAQMATFWETSHTSEEANLREDVDAAIAFLRGVVGSKPPLVLAGYSFGCAMLLHTAFVREAAALVMVAPTAGIHDYAACRSVTTPTLIVASEDDFAGDRTRLHELAQSIPGLDRLVCRRLDNHFFRGHEVWLTDLVDDFIG